MSKHVSFTDSVDEYMKLSVYTKSVKKQTIVQITVSIPEEDTYMMFDFKPEDLEAFKTFVANLK